MENKVESLKQVTLGGIQQSILVRGKEEDNPILLFLHGGPGTAQIGFMPKYQDLLEEEFLVVNWDQRGSGLSYVEGIPKETMNINQFVEDAVELIEYLKETYHKEKIYLMGHSWGSMLGMLLIHQYPNLFHGYIGVGQVANMLKGEQYLYDYLHKQAKETKQEEILEDLQTMGRPPYKDPFTSIPISRKWVNHFRGITWELDLNQVISLGMENSPYYKKEDISKWMKGSGFSVEHMLQEMLEVDLEKDIKKVDLPIYFFLGRHDYTTPSEIARAYLDQISAPEKGIVWFEDSAHMPMMEEPIKFQKMVKKLFMDKE